MTGKQMLKKYQQSGWVLLRVRGSHYIMAKNNVTVPIPYHTTELKTGTEKALLKTLKEVG